MATSDFRARAAADAGSAPESNSTLAPLAAADTAFNGDVGNHTCDCQGWAGSPGGSTCADPPPEIMPVSACGPITAMECTVVGSSGNRPLVFLSRTILCSARWRAVAKPPSTSTTLFCVG